MADIPGTLTGDDVKVDSLEFEIFDILMVDDEPDYNQARQEWLVKAGFKVQTIVELDAAWEYLLSCADENTFPKLIILDIMMPIDPKAIWVDDQQKSNISGTIAGLLFAEKIKNDKIGKNIKIVFLTVRNSLEPEVKNFVSRLQISIIEKGLMGESEFVQLIKEQING